MDNLITGDMMNIEHLSSNPNFEFIHHDVTKFIDIKGDLDYILHFASPASPIDYLKIPIQTLKVGALGTHNCLGLAKAKGARILVASTSEVYGDPEEHPQNESYNGNVNTIGYRSCYDEGKRCAETLFMDYKRQHKIDIKIVRIFNTYGPNMRKNDGRVISNFIVQALENKDITIYGSGKQTRSFQYIDDLVYGIVKTMNSNICGPVNLGNNNELSINDLAQKIIYLTGSASSLVLKPLPCDDPKRRKPDISLAKSKLNWEPKVKLSSGLNNTIKFFIKILR